MIDFSKLELSSSSSSNKILLQDSGSFNVPALPGAGNTFGSVTIPHSYKSDNLIFQVTTTGGTTDGVTLPWSSNDGRMFQYASVDSNNLYIYTISADASGLGAPGYTINYTYRVLVP